MARKPRWIFGGSQAWKKVQADFHKRGHGSCAASKVNGPKYGIAKQVNLVIVKAGVGGDETLDALDKILEDVREKKLKGRAVVNFSRSGTFSSSAFSCTTCRQPLIMWIAVKMPPMQAKSQAYYIKELIYEEDVVFIAPAGNDLRDEVLVCVVLCCLVFIA